MDISPEEHIAMVVRKVLAAEQAKRGDGRLGVCTSETPLMVRLHGDTTDTPAKALGGWTPATGPVLCFRAAGRLYVTEVEGV